MKIYLVRHGETTGDIEDRYGGSYDDHLTELGRSQLEDTANKLVGKGIEAIFTSTLIRAKESAEIISNKIGVSVEVREGLRERDYGILTGLTKKEALEKYPEAVEMYKDQLKTPPDGEEFLNFQERVLDEFKKITQENYNTVAVISHGGPIKQILGHLGKNAPPLIGDGEIIELEV